jgi:hypothetical protein
MSVGCRRFKLLRRQELVKNGKVRRGVIQAALDSAAHAPRCDPAVTAFYRCERVTPIPRRCAATSQYPWQQQQEKSEPCSPGIVH